MENLNVLVVFLAGLATFLSPCILPILPTYLSYISGVALEDSSKEKVKVFKATLLFVLGFSLAFTILQVIVINFANFGVKILGTDLIYRIFGIVTIVMALHLMGVIPIKFLMYQKRFEGRGKKLGSFFLGFFFGFGWTPCMGPIIFAVMAYIASAEQLIEGVVYLMVFLFAFSLPLLGFSLILDKSRKKLKVLQRYSGIIEKGAGVLLLIMGVLLFMNRLDIFLYI